MTFGKYFSRDFRSISLKLQAANGDETVVKVHPLILCSHSPYLDKVVFPREPDDGQDCRDFSLTVFDVWAVADVINSFYGETTNSGQRPTWEQKIRFEQAKDFLLIQKFSPDCFLTLLTLTNVPQGISEFSRYLTDALYGFDSLDSLRNVRDAKESNLPTVEDDKAKETFRRKLADAIADKAKDFYTYFSGYHLGVMQIIKDEKVVSPKLVKILAEEMPYEDVFTFESLVDILEICVSLEQASDAQAQNLEDFLKDIWDDLDYAIGEKYMWVDEDCKRRYEKLGFRPIEYQTPTKIVGLASDRLLSFSLTEKESPPVIYGALASATCFDVKDGKIMMGTTSGILNCDQRGTGRQLREYLRYKIDSVKIFKDFVYAKAGDKNLVFDEDVKNWWTLGLEGDCIRDNRGYLYKYDEGDKKIIKRKISPGSGVPLITYRIKEIGDKKGPIYVSRRGTFVAFKISGEQIFVFDTLKNTTKLINSDRHNNKIFFSRCEKYIVSYDEIFKKTKVHRTESGINSFREYKGKVIATAEKRNLFAIYNSNRLLSIYNFEGEGEGEVLTVINVNKLISMYFSTVEEGVFSEDCSLLAISGKHASAVFDINSGDMIFHSGIGLVDIKFN
jgi:hypothetical protein